MHSQEVDVPGARAAVEVSLWSVQPTAGGDTHVRWRWLVADLTDGRQALVGVLGVRETFEALPLDEVFDSVELAP
ncbi:hypothetical protein ET495_15520 [Xylanimonas allomyrinae]|uniref:Uncharacterized protein n=1 Tax=Xylanimonas allomyrinae TaxID=2509459 RepID=A0A4P6EPL9_9MICO|nr:hypothetical protein [Xylanimonas allomyrinae]QAY64385.1 hypothetical protein ET495_15520 [Xylanimonas allomyrinae]